MTTPGRDSDPGPAAPERVGLAAAAAVWLKIGLLGFGGPGSSMQ